MMRGQRRVQPRSSAVAATHSSARLRGGLFLALLLLCWAPTVDSFGMKKKEPAQEEVECEADGTCTKQKDGKPLQCGVYMAPSTLGEFTSMGIYTGIPLHANTIINYPEISVPLLFREFGDHVEGYHDGVLWDRYVWEGHVIGVDTYVETNREASKAVFVPGVGCTVNSVLDMNNIQSTHGARYDTAGLHRATDPGSGAFSPYHGAKTIATEELPAGAELFASYGDYWIPDIPGAQIALEEYLEEAEEFLQEKYYPFIAEHEKELTEEVKQGLWEFTAKDFPVFSKAFTNLPKDVPWSEVESALKNQPDIDDDDDSEDSSIVRDFIRKQSIRSVEWLDENGYCQDHLKPGLSTIPQAGRGAFASRFLPAGTVVGYAPLVHVGLHGRDIWTVTVGNEEGSWKQYDLILNYSFGHRNSTVLLTPYGAMVNYINHGGKEKANVRIRWPDKELIAHKPEYLERSPGQLADTLEKIGLSFEYVALRDIEEGEEVLIDYGEEWEKAWQEHVAKWEPVTGAVKYVHSSDWKEEFYRTLEEQENNPYPLNLHTMCHESYTVAADGSYQWVDVLRPLPFRIYCDVLERRVVEGEPPLYTVEMHGSGGSVVVQNVPEAGIFLYDRAFSSDWNLPNVFRHELAIPDDIMPKAWMNGPPPPPNFD